MKDVFSLDGKRLEAIHAVIDNSQIDERHSVFPVEYIIEPRPWHKSTTSIVKRPSSWDCKRHQGARESRNGSLRRRSAHDCFMYWRDDSVTRRLPRHRDGISLRCAQAPHYRARLRRGAAGLAHAGEYLRAFPDRTALLVAVELPTLTFQRKDFSQANLISAVLFGDGAAGVVVTGREAAGPRILTSECFLFPNSLDAMGFDLRDSGFHIVLSKDVPQLIRERVRELVEGFLARQGLRREDISAFILHPGGQKLLSFMEAELDLTRTDTELSWDVLRRFGNLSSASVLFILQEWMSNARCRRGVMACSWPSGRDSPLK